jgi:iron complex transport system ATP-binding protein
MNQIIAKNVSYRYGTGELAVDDLSIALQRGELVALIGPNGAGKSTLLDILAGFTKPQAGGVRIDGVEISALRGRQRALKIAYLEQGAEVHWPLTAYALASLGRIPHLRPWQRHTADDAEAVDWALRCCEVEDLSERVVSTLSGGERARVLLARALAVRPSYLLVDEPVSGLDPYHQLHVMELLQRMAGQGAAVLAVLHDLTLALRFCDRVCLLDSGRVAANDTPQEVLRGEVLASVYGVSLKKGLVEGEPFALPWKRQVSGAQNP